MNLGCQLDLYFRTTEMNIDRRSDPFPKLPKINHGCRFTQPFKYSIPYRFLNLSKQISIVDLEIKHDLDRRFAKLPTTLHQPLKLEF
jgi:hypothetical protein